MALQFVGASPRSLTGCTEHKHPLWEIVLNLEGEGSETIDGREYPFSTGTVRFIPPNVPHVKSSEGGFRDIFIRADSIALRGMPDARHEPMTFEDDAEGSVAALMQMMLCRYLKTNKNDVALDLMYELLLQLVTEKTSGVKSDQVVEDICHRSALSFNDPELSVSDVLESTGYQKDYIRRRFFRACGVTPLQYLTSLRMEYAKNLLKRRRGLGLSVADVGTMCGYYDGGYFSRVFKKQVGVTPEAYV